MLLFARRPFQPYQMFASKAKSLPLWSTLQVCHSCVGSWGHIFSRVWPFYERAVSDLDWSMHISLWVYVAHSSFIVGLHTTKNTASGFHQTYFICIVARPWCLIRWCKAISSTWRFVNLHKTFPVRCVGTGKAIVRNLGKGWGETFEVRRGEVRLVDVRLGKMGMVWIGLG